MGTTIISLNNYVRLLSTHVSCLLALLLLTTPTVFAQESPWLLIPTVSNDPKLGFKGGVMGGYLYKVDADSNFSMMGGFANYSDTDSYTGGLFTDLYWGANRNKLRAGIINGHINNEYEDYLGTGQTVETEDNLKGLFIRYSHLIFPKWYLGAQFLSSNYAIGIDELTDEAAHQIGLTGFDSNGIGLVLEYDTRDNVRSSTLGHYFNLNNIAYREGLGGDESFDVFQADYRWFSPFGEGHVFALQLKGRWTSDAPQSGYSSLQLRGYTRGNYLDENYTHFDMEARIHLRGRWGATMFAGISCLYSSMSDCGDNEDLFASAGAGITYVLKPASGFIIKTEYAVGEKDNSAFYIKLGQKF
ncbi:BamA/TamA family outer membrane protein [Aestuariicella hydrocarbonica]|uniref:BamA/TamA family outer membrane protein n=1 Tax=Pseudomaricurvus hydrocarbonicus TaxID=1470433 RepID=A0A9E5T189_9GAMM|nr:BamA/TamA family outer membrane protein [Aestuariicella hydrocarbonica]NHO67035.1 BamA/TamA family outer membrane protein [Aestuariicella hydrocarbonica]